ncbi:flavodoxin family protein [Gordonia soli]|uniref:NADPH-dependent FMN reductase-like domain-containing protein n=1 Tax=Gordonia soli NBRC 108243 TaxID=1223545 RepID=M0QS55_9ACTN|nr:NAD(P)H-dependent oxidoreductase [Gordonia soli]GAC70857.1 hypothetical protein GS4_42_00350 [Gordonia soli NBRC 108243]
MSRLLVVHHTPSPGTREILEAVIAGAGDPEIEGVDVRAVAALGAGVADFLDADGYVFGTPANIGYMSGALKHFFDTVYYPSLGDVDGRPYSFWVHGNNDTAGASAAIRTIADAMSLTLAAQPLGVTEISKETRDAAYELGAVSAASLM